ncbi:MAG: HNH endonuclease [Methylococcales bacterium]
MYKELENKFVAFTIDVFNETFGNPFRETKKVIAWKVGQNMEVVVQIDQPNKQQIAYIWIPYPLDGQPVPEIALEYPGEAGRHSGTYASAGLSKGLPALKLFVHSKAELDDTVLYIKAFRDSCTLPEVKKYQDDSSSEQTNFVDFSTMSIATEPKKRREAIPRVVQREVWQRDGGRCVECGTKEKLCFDHIIPFSRGGSNTIRNLQLLCEKCNLSKGNRI